MNYLEERRRLKNKKRPLYNRRCFSNIVFKYDYNSTLLYLAYSTVGTNNNKLYVKSWYKDSASPWSYLTDTGSANVFITEYGTDMSFDLDMPASGNAIPYISYRSISPNDGWGYVKKYNEIMEKLKNRGFTFVIPVPKVEVING